MKLIKIEINNIRGIHHFDWTMDGHSFVIYGPNGSGKSAVADAVDFLVSGKISRLTGEGTGRISLEKYGAHIDHKPEEAFVSAVIKIPQITDPIEIKRFLNKPKQLICKDAHRTHLSSIQEIAKRGQHILTRKEILKYITSVPKTRAEQIQALLNLESIEKIRKTFMGVKNKCKNELGAAERDLKKREIALANTINAKKFELSLLLKFININREILEAAPIKQLSNIKSQIGPPIKQDYDKIVNIDLLKKDFEKISEIFSPRKQQVLLERERKLRKVFQYFRSRPDLIHALNVLKLTEEGLKLIDKTGDCPLCDTRWKPGELEKHLRGKIKKAKEAQAIDSKVRHHSSFLLNNLQSAIYSINQIYDALIEIKAKPESLILLNWRKDIEAFVDLLYDPLKKPYIDEIKPEKINKILEPLDYEIQLRKMQNVLTRKLPKKSPVQTAWDILTRLETQLEAYEEAADSVKKGKVHFKRANLLYQSFIDARDEVLEKLYKSIESRFIQFYKTIHGSDEGSFTAEFRPKEAGINFNVDFYGRGIHPPHALHSEGHQDSMGLCLFLALSERLNFDLINLIILDDVIMSIDKGHRRQICRLVSQQFPDQQFLITTHDRTWAKQLQTERIVAARNMQHFYNWTVDAGPHLKFEKVIWDEIEENLLVNDVPAAAAKLRRNSEEFFRETCERLRVKVVCKLNGQWALGDLVPEVMKKHRTLMGKAINIAHIENRAGDLSTLQEMQNNAHQIFSKTQAEQWAVNATVHYNNWANLEPNDFRPVLEAFKEFYSVFTCKNCRQILEVLTSNYKEVILHCACGENNWNLER